MKTITRSLFGSLSGDAAISSTAFGAQGFATAGLTVKHSPSQASVSGTSNSWHGRQRFAHLGAQFRCRFRPRVKVARCFVVRELRGTLRSIFFKNLRTRARKPEP